MVISHIKAQVKRRSRVSVFIDNKYSFSLSEDALLTSKIKVGQELNRPELKQLKKLSGENLLETKALNYTSRYSKTDWEVRQYLKNRGADSSLIDIILNKLTNIGLVDDAKFARSFVSSRTNLKPTSKRKIIAELKKRRISQDNIEAALEHENLNEKQALKTLIENKRRQSKYKDDEKLMSYLARQGFNYSDIKDALT